ncbi:MAG: phenylalanine--tRNA ligase subunit alpha [Candidatus Micrarchaeota archaeon]|nr:phenylalanine--tRNA ligase subunit alpha [Candidatus Micrarchaeota archaeon]
MLSPLEFRIISQLQKAKGGISAEQLASELQISKDTLYSTAENLSVLGYVELKKSSSKEAQITDEGKSYANAGLPETQLLRKISRKSMKVQELSDPVSRIGLQWGKSNGLLTIDGGMLNITAKGKEALSGGIAEEKVLTELGSSPQISGQFESKHKRELENLLKRKLITIKERSSLEISLTATGSEAASKGHLPSSQINSLNRSIIASKGWKGKEFEKYNVNLEVAKEIPAKAHPLRRMINQIKGSYVSMGFKEISGPIVIPAFWNFDTLFTPQDHPARETQDTFYLSNPQLLEITNKGVVAKVKAAHEEAWHSEWVENIAKQGVLRTQMTSVSIQELYNIAKYKEYKLPLKLFSTGRVFRNENIDYKHLTDFYQSDGIIIGENLTMANLFDTLTKIYGAIGIKIKFKPAYFPFVEPGAEVYGYHEQRKEWLEIAGCGILRREITGIARKSVTVLAWGSSVERLLLIKDPEIERLSDLYNNGVGWLRSKRLV